MNRSKDSQINICLIFNIEHRLYSLLFNDDYSDHLVIDNRLHRTSTALLLIHFMQFSLKQRNKSINQLAIWNLKKKSNRNKCIQDV